MFIPSERSGGGVLLLGARAAERDVAEVARVLRLLQAPPVSADAVCIGSEGHAVVLGIAFVFDRVEAAWPSPDRVAGDAFIAVFRAAGIGVERLDDLPAAVSSHLLAVLRGSHGS